MPATRAAMARTINPIGFASMAAFHAHCAAVAMPVAMACAFWITHRTASCARMTASDSVCAMVATFHANMTVLAMPVITAHALVAIYAAERIPTRESMA